MEKSIGLLLATFNPINPHPFSHRPFCASLSPPVTVQKFALFICWACCPALFALLAIPPVAYLGSAHLMRTIAIICWPIGFAVASTFSTGLLKMMFNDQHAAGASIILNLGAALESLLIIVVVALWSAASTLLAPAFIQRILVGQPGTAGVNSKIGSLFGSTILPGAVAGLANGFSLLREQWQELKSRGDSRDDNDGSPPVPPITTPLPATNPGPDDPVGHNRLQNLLKDQ